MDKEALGKLIENNVDGARSYSGRGMYGNECLGVRGEEAIDIMLDIIEGILDYIDTVDEIEEIIALLRNYRVDNMGLGMIVYFPRIPATSSIEAEEDEDEDGD